MIDRWVTNLAEIWCFYCALLYPRLLEKEKWLGKGVKWGFITQRGGRGEERWEERRGSGVRFL